jgi:hypothetical protein
VTQWDRMNTIHGTQSFYKSSMGRGTATIASRSFPWALLWICSRYDNGTEIENPPFHQFEASYVTRRKSQVCSSCSPLIRVKIYGSVIQGWRDTAVVLLYRCVCHCSSSSRFVPSLTIVRISQLCTAISKAAFLDSSHPRSILFILARQAFKRD